VQDGIEHAYSFDYEKTGEGSMNPEVMIAMISGVLILAYLTYTVIRPEKF